MKIEINASDYCTYVIELKKHSTIGAVQNAIVHINVNDIESIRADGPSVLPGKMDIDDFIRRMGVNGVGIAAIRFSMMYIRD